MGDVRGIDLPFSGGAGPSWPSDQFTSGDPDVDAVLARLARLTDTSVAEQPELYSEISESLLAELDQGHQE
ncbi:hypothetical protein [Arthrobacter sp. H41]|uniref:hypothetical protein n=1 Tax=Arthrobacter sp. H41 TaxID=1312978 RepID=UPI00047CDFEF|nr:hypothetical protein [Arthrobacter sp. H41]